MSNLTLTKIRMRNGVWEGRLSGAQQDIKPIVGVRYLDRYVEGVSLSACDEPGCWDVAIPIPAEAVADGVHTFVISDEVDDARLGDFTLIAGESVADDLRAEMELLRAELDMLKRAFRRHCLETM
ncbi:MAG: hypothetical protein KDK02_04230 [Rhodobacteraceae bacterium]|nr:hypothetical protein [Paracoccaceae bacterium]